MQTNLQRKILASTQSTLNFQPSVKPEPKEYRDRDSEEDGSPGSSSSHSSNVKPNWGDLPNPDMTISGFGKRGNVKETFEPIAFPTHCCSVCFCVNKAGSWALGHVPPYGSVHIAGNIKLKCFTVLVLSCHAALFPF